MPKDVGRSEDFSDLFLSTTGVDFGGRSQVEHIFLSETPPDTEANYNPSALVTEFLSRVYSNVTRPRKRRKITPRAVNPETLR